MSQVFTPGKLFLGGEYAVVQPGHLSLVAAVDKGIQAKLSPRPGQSGTIWSSLQAQVKVPWTLQEGLGYFDQTLYPLIQAPLQVTLTYLKEMGEPLEQAFDLSFYSNLEGPEGQKYGLGSSGAITVATVAAILAHFHPSPPMVVYKLAAISQALLNQLGSWGDLAASAFGGLIAYTSPDREWLKTELENSSLLDLIEGDWPGLSIQALQLPSNLSLLVGWTQSPASTDQAIGSLAEKLQDPAYQPIYQVFLRDSHTCMVKARQACLEDQDLAFLAAIEENRALLRKFAQDFSIPLETPSLTQLIRLAQEAGFVAKTSGAGGGDCGICFAKKSDSTQTLVSAWQTHGIVPLPLAIYIPQEDPS